ncbi:MAG TPA: response regulator [Dehalococcoidia bacterium]|jgi:DNA-binding response OmpR family regulator
MAAPSGSQSRLASGVTWQSAALLLWSSAPRLSRVLIVDDDPSILGLLGAIFRAAGFTVATAPDGLAALDSVRAAEPEVIVLDLEMPAMNGREFYRRLRADNFTMPVMILSAYNPRAAQLELGAQAYASKPFDPDQLVDSVRSLLEAAGG